MKTFSIKTLGCKVNQYESQVIRERLQAQGLSEANGAADICVVNTCTVTASADRKSRNAIRGAHRNNKKAKIVVTGCLVKFDKQMLVNIGNIDYIIPKSFFSGGISYFSHHARAFVKVQDGCDNHCSYCKVSLVRGKSRSRPLKEITEEVRRLALCGFKEIVLTGVCIGSYGLDLKPRMTLAMLIEELLKLSELRRLRLSSIEPNFVSKELIDIFSVSGKLCPHIHIPMQSGDNKILKLMNRNYTREDYVSLAEEIKKKIPQVSLTTDVLLGFPGEEDENFANTLKTLRQVRPLRIHGFIYSKRDRTAAARSKNDGFNQFELSQRMNQLNLLAEELSYEFRNSFLNKKLYVLAEDFKNGQLSGYSGNYIKVDFLGDFKHINQVLPVRIEEVKRGFTKGVILLDQKQGSGDISYCNVRSYEKQLKR